MARASSRLPACLAAGWLVVVVSGCGSTSVSPQNRDVDLPGEGGADASAVLPDTGPDAALPPDASVAADTDGDAGPLPDTFGATDSGPVSPDAGGVDLGPIPPAPATVVVLPDTQYYSSSFPDIFAAQTRWIVAQKSARNIAAALHVGDLVEYSTDTAEWMVANSSMRVLDGIVPYVLVPGNHDSDANRVGLIDNYFSPTTMPWITETMGAGQIENNYALVDIGPQKWLVLGLEFGPRDAVLTWADGVLKANWTLPAIIVTHAYLYADAHRYDYAVYGASQAYYPQSYGFTPKEGSNDGEQIWQELIVPNPNVRLVFCGHFGVARLTSLRADGSRVHQMLSDYQWADSLGGSGYLRLLEFDYGKREIRVQTYSPYLDLFMTDDANQFTLSLEL